MAKRPKVSGNGAANPLIKELIKHLARKYGQKRAQNAIKKYGYTKAVDVLINNEEDLSKLPKQVRKPISKRRVTKAKKKVVPRSTIKKDKTRVRKRKTK